MFPGTNHKRGWVKAETICWHIGGDPEGATTPVPDQILIVHLIFANKWAFFYQSEGVNEGDVISQGQTGKYFCLKPGKLVIFWI